MYVCVSEDGDTNDMLYGSSDDNPHEGWTSTTNHDAVEQFDPSKFVSISPIRRQQTTDSSIATTLK